MKNRFTCLWQTGITVLLSVVIFNSVFSQTCDNSNQYFTFSYTGPDTIFVDPVTCEGVLNWPMNTPSVTCDLQPPQSCSVNFFDHDPGLTGLNRGATVPVGTNVAVYYVLEGEAITSSGTVPVQDTFCFDVFFSDGQAPVFSAAPPPDMTVNCYASVPAASPIQATDDCDPSYPKAVTASINDNATICTGGTVTYTWSTTDNSGNNASVSQVITVIPDTIAPVIGTMPVSAQADCAVADYQTWMSNQRSTVQSTASDNCGIATITDNAPAVFPNACDTVEVTFIVTDSCGRVATAMASYAITDTEAPVLSGVPLADTLIISCDDAVPNPPNVTATDNCSPNLIVFLSEMTTQTNNGSCSDFDYQITRNWFVSDSCGNIATDRQVIIVRDSTPPVFDVPSDVSLTCGQSTDPDDTGRPANVSDDCDGDVDISYTDTRDTLSCIYHVKITRAWRVVDICGNATVKNQIITINDTEAPTFTVPADTTVNCDRFNTLRSVSRPTNVSDNCDPDPTVSFTDVTIAGSCVNTLKVERKWTVTDTCNNATTKTQTIMVIDTTAPVFTQLAADLDIDCDTSTSITNTFNAWIAANGNASATDNCSMSNLNWMAFNSGTNNPATLPAQVCPSPVTGVLQMQTVDFIVMDECGNEDTTTATFRVLDNNAPVLQNCPDDIVADNNPGHCSADIQLFPPQVRDDCNVFNTNQVATSSVNITAPGPFGDPDVIVDPIFFTLNIDGPPATVDSDLQLDITLNSVDAEGSREFFRIIDEDGNILGQTNATPAQCGTSTTSFTITDRDKVARWFLDGILELRLEPNQPTGLPGRFSINDICSGANVALSATYTAQISQNITMEYTVNNSARIPVNPIAPFVHTFDVGSNTVTYYITDCAGNQDSCSFGVEVNDVEAPVLDCPSDITLNAEQDSCSAALILPLPNSFTDNCGVPGQFQQTAPADSADRLLTFYEDPNLGDFLAQNRTIRFTNITNSAFGSGGTISVFLKGDVEQAGEFFTVFGENNTLLGTTETGQPHVVTGDCNNVGTATFYISPSQLNDWASDGEVTIQLISNINIPVPPGGPGSGINPCIPANVSTDGDNDGSSMAWATLSFSQIAPTFYTTGATTINPTQINVTSRRSYRFNAGLTSVFYYATDVNGITDTCSFQVEIVDNQPPQATCTPSIVEINPGGSTATTISITDVGGQNSTDNCGIDAVTVFPNTFTCDQIGDTINVAVVAEDVFGNTDTCFTFVRIVAEEPQPNYAYQCGIDTLFLFSNPPSAPGNVVYSYKWFGPLGNLISTQENPVITDLSGFVSGNYCVEITGLTGCTSEACVNIPVELRPPQPSFTVPDKVCWDTDDIVFDAVPPQGINAVVSYNWYSGTFPGGTLIATTQVPTLTIQAPHNVNPNTANNTCYYLIIDIDGCESQPSNVSCVTVVRPPDAVVSEPTITICEGELLQLNTPVSGQGLNFSWEGPGGFVANTKNPVVTDSVNTAIHAGNYNLIISKDGCPSNQATTIVNVIDKPNARPVIFPASAVRCEGQELTFSTNLTGVDVYVWIAPTGQEIRTTSPGLTIILNPSHEGPWRVYGEVNTANNICLSDISAPAQVTVNSFPMSLVAAAQPNPVCEGNDVQLQVTPTLNNASYVWFNPQGNNIAAIQNPVLTNVQMRDTGVYRVLVTNEFGCSREAIVRLNISPGVEVVAVSNDAPNCFTSSTTVNLSLIVFPPDVNGSYQYDWSGPCQVVDDSIGVVPNFTSDCNGVYTVVVTNEVGCTSQVASTIVDSRGPLAIPDISVTPDKATYCESENITLRTTGYNGQNVTYTWTTPMGQFTTSVPSLVLDSITVASDNGRYSVRANVDGCETASSGEIDITVNPSPVALPDAVVPCEGGTLRLIGNYSPAVGNPSFRWETPGGSIFNTQNPPIQNADPDVHNGTYVLTVTLNGCTSLPATVEVDITEAPVLPLTLPAQDVCIGSGDSLMLCVNPNTATPGAEYIWTNFRGDTVGITTSLCLVISDFSAFNEDSFPFFVEASKGGCSIKNSAPLIVNFNTIPTNNADAGEDFEVCEDEPVILSAMPPDRGEGCWNLLNPIGGVTITNPCQSNTSVLNLPPGNVYNFRWALANGACVDYDTDTVAVRIFEIENANAGRDRIDTCQINALTLQAIPSQSGLGMWTQEPVQAQLGVVIQDPSNPNTRVTFPGPGTYRFTWVIPDVVCGGDEDFTIVNISRANPFAGVDFGDCGDGCTLLEANTSQTGVWTAPDRDIEFVDPEEPATVVCNLKEGINLFVWTIDNGVCGDASHDTVIVDYSLAPLAIDDYVNVRYGGTTALAPADNDAFTGNVTLRIIQGPQSGLLTSLDNNRFEYTAALNFVGDDIVIYELCSTDPDCECSEGTMVFQVGANINRCSPPSIITPNGDNKNEVFSIPCLADASQFPKNELIIFNQWGDEVFRQSPYQNQWNGTFDGQQLPAGTYFYILDLKTGDKPKTGYVIIQR